MNDSGFRPYPGDEIIEKWALAGGLWLVTTKEARFPSTVSRPQNWGSCFAYRPIHPAQGWNHYPWMWQVLTGEDMTPTKPGMYWWRNPGDDKWQIIKVYLDIDYGLMAKFPSQRFPGFDHGRVDLTEVWGGPVEGMPGEVGHG